MDLPPQQVPSRRQLLLLAAIVVFSVLVDFLIATRFEPKLRRSSDFLFFLLAWTLPPQWSLASLVCALGGRNPLRGLLLGATLSTFGVGAMLLGAGMHDALIAEYWAPLVLLPWLLPISAAPLSLLRLAFGWRLVADEHAPPDKVALADYFALMLYCASGVVAFRFVQDAAADQYQVVLVIIAYAIGIFAGVALVIVTPTLWWLRKLQSRPHSTGLFLNALASFPIGLAIAAVVYDARGLRWGEGAIEVLVALQILFGYFFGCLSLLWRFGFRIQARRDRSDSAAGTIQLAPTHWQRYAIAWLLLIGIGFGILNGISYQRKRTEAAFAALLTRTGNSRFTTGGRKVLRFFRDNTVTDSDLKLLSAANDLRRLEVVRTRITDRGMSHLNRVETLTSLTLRDASVTSAGLRKLASPEKFTSLILDGCQVGGTDGSVLPRFRNLDSLGLNRTNIADQDISQLGGLTRLAHLGLANTAVTDTALRQLSGLTSLKALDLANTRVTGLGFETWGQQRGLRYLAATDTPFSNQGLEQLQKFPNLEFLSLSRTQVTSTGLACLSDLLALRVIELDGTGTGGEEVQRLLQLPELVNLSLADTQVGNEAFQGSSLRKLHRLDLAGTRISDDACRELARSTTLADLRLARTAVTDTGIEYLAGLPLEVLDLRGTAVTANGLLSARLSTLKLIFITGDQFSSEGVARLKSAGIETSFLDLEAR